MSKNYAELEPTAVRRADRAVEDDAWISAFLHRAPFCALATVYDGQPFINTNIFVYDEENHVIYTHNARVGRTPANIAEHNKICFSVSEMGRLLPAAEALEFSVEYAGVSVFGTAVFVEDAVEAEHGLQLLLDKYAPHLLPGRDYHAITAEELKRTAVFRINIDSWVGKKKEVADDFPGAFLYGTTG